MQQHHDDDLGWVKDAERWICQLQGVRQCKIDLDARGEVSGIHVVATAEREPRHVVRDVEGLLKARLDLTVYYKKIGVVQVVDTDAELAEDAAETAAPAPAAPRAAPQVEAEPAPRPEPAPAPAPASPTAPPRPAADAGVVSRDPWPLGGGSAHPAVLLEEAAQQRLECTGVGLMVSGATLTATVELMAGDATAQAREAGPNHAGIDLQLMARATVAAISDLLDEPVALSVADVREAEAAGDKVVVAAVDLVEGRRSERFFGVCSLRIGHQQAAVYAVLDALNRRLELMTFREGDPRN